MTVGRLVTGVAYLFMCVHGEKVLVSFPILRRTGVFDQGLILGPCLTLITSLRPLSLNTLTAVGLPSVNGYIVQFGP